ncbi:MAG: M48 family metallopeptidase [Planctomycetes bacterium]|nr:M48 family metallopeptidase [Planctomycetota bacterium]
MDFFGHQEQARRASGRLVWLFLAAVVSIIVLIYVAAEALLVVTDSRGGGGGGAIDWPVLGAVAGVTVAIVGGAMLVKTAQLRSGGGKVAELLGGRLVDVDTQDPHERVLRNVVEEMAIASGVPVPDVYVLEHEQGINAFAAGWSPADAAVAVTRGALEHFDRDELQGVIAHEFSHVFHGDMRLNIRLMGTLFGIVCITVVGRILLRATSGSRSSSDKKGAAAGIAIFGLVVMVIGYAGVFFARLIQSAVSRQREYLADASAVQYTRNPRGIGMALAKIGGYGARLQSPHTEEASHMLFADGISRLGGAMATHPPIERRIERVLPGFLRQLQANESMTEAVAATPSQPAAGASGFAGAAARPRTPAAVLEHVGDPQQEHVDAARHLLAALPLELAVASREPARAPALALALLLDADGAVRERQAALVAAEDRELGHRVLACHRDVAAVDRALRLPLLELAMPTLRQLPAGERRRLRSLARALAFADGQLTPFEFALLKTLQRHVRLPDEAPPRPRGKPVSLVERAADAAVVLSAIAHAGAERDADAAAAFSRGVEGLGFGVAAQLLPREAVRSPQRLDQAIEALTRVSPLGHRNLMHACANVAAADGVLQPDEVDLLRALGELWDCPVPLATNAPA